MRIQNIHVDNYKLFSKFNLNLPEGITVISGTNGSGKTALIELMNSLKQFLAMPSASSVAVSLDEAFPVSILPRWKIKKTGCEYLSVSVDLSECYDGESYNFSYELKVRFNFLDRISRVEEEVLRLNGEVVAHFDKGNLCVITDDKREVKFNADWNQSGVVMASHNNSKIRIFGEALSKLYCLSIVPEKIEAGFIETTQNLAFDAVNFASWRSYNASRYSEKIQPIVDCCKYFLPNLVSMNDIQTGEGSMLKLRMNTDHKDKSYELSFRELSTGQKKLIVLYSLMGYLPNGASVFIDEPENFLAPAEIQPWLNLMNSTWEDKDAQIVAISHNTDTLDWYTDEVLVFDTEGVPPCVVLVPTEEVMEND